MELVLRWLAALLLRGPDAPFVLGDLDEAMRRDLGHGYTPWRARGRYLANMLGSALSLALARVRTRRPLLPALGASWLDVKLGLRMLVKYPGLTVVAVFALALGIPASLAPLHLLGFFEAPLPFEEGERIVGLRHRSPAAFELRAVSLHEYAVWRETLTSFEGTGAALSYPHNVIADDGRIMDYRGARMTASAFDVVRVAPVLGRPLIESDEAPGAPDVVVISHEVWQTFLAGDPSVVGRTLRVGGVAHTVVGVMPEGFHFPYIDRVWLPLRREAIDAPGKGPEVWVFGRLAEGVSEAQALAELRVVHGALADAFPDAYGALRPELVPFAFLISGSPLELRWAIAGFQLFALLLLAVACGNVGTLILARTAARSAEVAVRTALGASRARIVSQLFVEALLLALLSTGMGLVIGSFVSVRVGRIVQADLPFWWEYGVTRTTVVQALMLAVFSALVAGVLPALRATGRNVQGTLQRTGSGGAGAAFGRMAGALIVTEVALGVVCLFLGTVVYRATLWSGPPELAIPADRILTAELELVPPFLDPWAVERTETEQRARQASVQQEMLRRLSSEPGVEGAALTRFLPGQGHSTGYVEVEGVDLPPGGGSGHRILRGWVGAGFFGAVGQTIFRGREFGPGDVPGDGAAGSTAIVVNTTFVERVLRGGNALGRRIRYASRGGSEPGPWMEIVGVVGPLGMIDGDVVQDNAGLYHPAAAGAWNPVKLAVRVRGDPATLAPRLRLVAAEVEPGAIIRDPLPLGELEWGNRWDMRWTAFGLAVVAAIAVVLSLAGLYALMTFTVAQRTREIGLRTALGADAGEIMRVIAKRALAQLALGVALGAGGLAAIIRATAPDTSFSAFDGWPLLLAATAGAIVLLGVAACIVPTLRGLRIRPMEAMRV
jgi:predicted permease